MYSIYNGEGLLNLDGYGHGAGEERGWKIDHFLCTSLMDDPIKYFIKNIFFKIILTTLNKFLKT